MEEIFKLWTYYLSSGIEACAAVIIGLAAIEATIKSLKLFMFDRNEPGQAKDIIRIRLGRWLALALEFELAADILGTAIAPTWDEIGKLAAIVVLRTALNFFLQKEIEQSSGVENNHNELK